MKSDETVEHHRLGFSHHKIYTAIEIEATPAQVWETLTDFESYPEWAEFFLGFDGEFKDNGKGEVSFQAKDGGKTNKFEHEISAKKAGISVGATLFYRVPETTTGSSLKATGTGQRSLSKPRNILGILFGYWLAT